MGCGIAPRRKNSIIFAMKSHAAVKYYIFPPWNIPAHESRNHCRWNCENYFICSVCVEKLAFWACDPSTVPVMMMIFQLGHELGLQHSGSQQVFSSFDCRMKNISKCKFSSKRFEMSLRHAFAHRTSHMPEFFHVIHVLVELLMAYRVVFRPNILFYSFFFFISILCGTYYCC